MSFATNTGNLRRAACPICGLEVEQEEIRVLAGRVPAGSTYWEPQPHRAPCGAHCAGGGTEPEEQDVHIPPFAACLRCGATDTEVARIIVRDDGQERIVFHHYTAPYCADLGYRIELQTRVGIDWRVKSRWPTNHPDSLDLTIEWAKRYVPWLTTNECA
jgi:hypothetical protein